MRVVPSGPPSRPSRQPMGRSLGTGVSAVRTWTPFLLSSAGETCEMSLRVLELVFFFYFASHIPITLFIDLQALLPEHVYPQQVSYFHIKHTLSPATQLTRVFSSSWRTSWHGTLRTSKTRWCSTPRSGSSHLFSARLCFKRRFSPLQRMRFWKVC